MTKSIVKHFEEKKVELKVKLARVHRLALTTHYWTALANESYITTTCHFLLFGNYHFFVQGTFV